MMRTNVGEKTLRPRRPSAAASLAAFLANVLAVCRWQASVAALMAVSLAAWLADSLAAPWLPRRLYFVCRL